MDAKMQALIDAPLRENAGKLNLPEGRRPIQREVKPHRQPGPNDLTPAQVKERKAKELSGKHDLLLDYYAETDKDAKTVAGHIGLYRMVEDGTDEESGKVKFKRILDVERVASELEWRRARNGASK